MNRDRKVVFRSEHLPVAVAARSLESAQNFAKTHNVDKAYGSYQELAKDPDVEVAYIGVIAPLHLELTKMMLNAGWDHFFNDSRSKSYQKYLQASMCSARNLWA